MFLKVVLQPKIGKNNILYLVVTISKITLQKEKFEKLGKTDETSSSSDSSDDEEKAEIKRWKS